MARAKGHRSWTEAHIANALHAIATRLDENINDILKRPMMPAGSLRLRAEADEGLRARYQAAIDLRNAALAERKRNDLSMKIDVIISRLEQGETLEQICAGGQMPSFSTLATIMKGNAVVRARITAASKVRSRIAKVAAAAVPHDRLDDMINRIRSGDSMKAAFIGAGFDIDLSTFWKRMKRRPALRDAIAKAVQYRETTDNRTGRAAYSGPQTRWSASDFSASITAVRTFDGENLREVLQAPLMPYSTVYAWSKQQPNLAELFESAVNEHRKRRKLRHAIERPKRIYKRRSTKIDYPQHVLRNGLLQLDLYRDVSSIFSTGLDADIRDDMISESILAVLEGKVSHERIREDAGEYGWQYTRRQARNVTISTDRIVAAGDHGGGLAMVDTLTTDEWSYEYAA